MRFNNLVSCGRVARALQWRNFSLRWGVGSLDPTTFKASIHCTNYLDQTLPDWCRFRRRNRELSLALSALDLNRDEHVGEAATASSSSLPLRISSVVRIAPSRSTARSVRCREWLYNGPSIWFRPDLVGLFTFLQHQEWPPIYSNSSCPNHHTVLQRYAGHL